MKSVCFLLIIFSSCGYELTRQIDKFTGDTIVRMENNKIEWGMTSTDMIQCNAIKVTDKQDVTNYYLQVSYWGKDWIFINEENSLDLLIDNISYHFNTYGRVARDVQTGSITEVATYLVTIELLKKIASSKNVEMRLNGQKGNKERIFDIDNISRFAEFVK